ncbi:MAG: phosphatase PAP2 family protein, partial [Chloroflexi bacterium]|nr:phosphatase PAP2 family protein [Chloroflexota bacterium]
MADASWEVEAIAWVQSASPDVLHQVARFMTVIGRSPISTIVPVVVIVAMWVSGQRHLSVFLSAAVVARILSVVVKELVDRPRPSASVVDVTYQLGGHSFPSGHALGATLFYGFLIYCAELSISNKPVRRL